MAGRHFRNASWGGLAAAARAATGLLGALLAVRLLGVGQYGHVATWLSLFVLYLSLNSSAFTMVVVKLQATVGDDNHSERDAAIAAAVRFCLGALTLLGPVTVALAAYAARLPLSNGTLPKTFGDAILLMGLLTAIQIVVALQASVIEGAGRLDLATKSQLAGPLVIVAGLSCGFLAGASLRLEAYLALLCGGAAVDMALLWSIRRGLGLPLSASKATAGNSGGVLQLLRSGGLLQATTLLNLFLEPANKFLLNHFAGSAAVAIYDLAMKVVWGIQHLVGSAMRVFLHIGSEEPAAVGRMFTTAVALLGVPVVVMHVAGSLFLFWVASYWMTIDAGQLMIFFGIAAISNLGMIFVTPFYLSLIGGNDLPFIFRTQVVLALVNVLVSSAAIPFIGLIGAALGLLMATVINAAAIYGRCRIEATVSSDLEGSISRVKGRVAIALALLTATIAWAAAGGGQPLVLFTIIAGLVAIMTGEPLIGRVMDQFAPRRSRKKA